MPGTAPKTPLARPEFILDVTPKEPRSPIKNTQSSLNAKTTNSEDGSRGAGETVTKKVKKVKKLDDEKIGKKVSSTVSDKISKKTPQKNKIANGPNKTPEKVSLDCLEKAKAASGDKAPASREEVVEKPKSKAETRKVSDDIADKRPRAIPRKAGIKVKKRPQKAVSQITTSQMGEDQISQGQFTEASVPDGPENASTKNEDTITVTNEEPQSPTNTPTSSHGASCSFLEKLQLGVKAYFNSRNSFICSDKNKKEGGNQTRARVRKEVKEDAQKTDPGFDFKNNVCISKSDLLLDQLRLYSNLGGKSSNFSKNKPKISKNVKSKKFKRCVRIQIPRKGYFYRSTMQYEIPEQPSSSPLELLEPRVKPQSKSKIQISGLAPTGSQVARAPKQKRVKKRRKPPPEVDFVLYSDSCSGSPSRLSSPNSPVDYDFSDDKLFSFEKQKSGKNSSLITELFTEFREREGNKPPHSGSSHRSTKKTPTGVRGDRFEVLESKGKKSTAFETLTNCLSSVLGENEIFQTLEITSVNPDDTNFQEEKPLITSVPVDYMYSSSFSGGMNPTALLMGEIDLHLELQNYLKAFNNVSVSKTRTKNTLHSNHTINPEELLQEEQFEGDEKSPSSQSSTSLGDEQINRRYIGELEEERVESRLAPSQTQLSNILRQMQKTKSTEKTCTGDNWMDGYEKVLPLESVLSRGFSNTIYSSGESMFGNIWTNTSPKVQKPFQPLISPFSVIDMIEIYKDILKHYEKLQRRGKKNIGCSLTTNLISYLHEKFTERQSRENLSNFSREVSNRQGWKHPIRKVKPIYLQEFVDLFQKVLRSSMPIRLITHLNNIISSWGYRSEYYVKRLKKRIETAKELTERRRVKSAQQEMPVREREEKLSSLENIVTRSSSVLKKEPSKSKNLQTMLEAFFNSEGEDLPGLSNLKGRVLVDVKLAGDQIRVNDLSFVKNRIPPRKKTDTDEASELIIETVGESEITDVLCDKTRTRKKKTIRKRSKPKGRLKKVEKDDESAKAVSEFEYDEVKLRAQHPIEPITESTETFQERVTSSSDTKITEKTPPDWDLFKKFIQYDNLFKDFLNKPKPTEADEIELDTKSYLKNLSFLLKTEPPDIVKSFVDIDSAMWNTLYQTPSAWSRTFFCMSASENLQQNPLTGTSKDKKLGNISKIQKKMQEFAMQRLKARAAILKPGTPYFDSASCLNNDECSALEILFSDKNPPRKVTGSKIYPNSMTDLIQSRQAEISNPIWPISSNSQPTDDGSFSLDLVHSDSFLKRFSNTSILERDTKMLFKNNSDLKFIPNTVVECKKEAKPFVTFAFTPEQLEKANFSAEDAVVIQEKKEPVVMATKSTSESEEAKNENQLKSIEKFIETMSVLNAKAKRKKKKIKVQTTEKKFNPPVFTERKLNTRCQTCQMLSKKEPPKRKKLAKIIYADSRSTIKSDKSSSKKARTESSKSLLAGGASHSTKPAERKSSHQVVKKTTEHKKETEDKTKDTSKISLNLEDIPLELLEALKDSINHVEDLKKKKAKMEQDLEKSLKEKNELDKTPKSFVLKIYCEKRGDSTKVEEIKKEVQHQKTETEEKIFDENKNLNVIEEVKEQEVEEEDSTFFDAVEKNLKDEMGALEEMKKNSKSRSQSPAPVVKPLPPPTEDRPPSGTSEKSEEIFNHISDSLIEGQITYSLLLLDYFLKKKEKLLSKDRNHHQKETQMSNLERNAWQKIVLILDALSEIIEKNGEDTLKAHLQSTKSVVSKILQNNVSRLDDLQKFNSSVTQLSSEKEDETFNVVRQCLKHLKEEVTGNEGKECEENTTESNKKEVVLTEIRQMNNKLVEDLRSLEKLFLVSNSDKSNTSLEEKTVSEAPGASADENVAKTSGCSQLMQCLMKVWNSRMSLNSYPSGCFR